MNFLNKFYRVYNLLKNKSHAFKAITIFINNQYNFESLLSSPDNYFKLFLNLGFATSGISFRAFSI